MLDRQKPQPTHTFESICSQFISATPTASRVHLVETVNLPNGDIYAFDGCRE